MHARGRGKSSPGKDKERAARNTYLPRHVDSPSPKTSSISDTRRAETCLSSEPVHPERHTKEFGQQQPTACECGSIYTLCQTFLSPCCCGMVSKRPQPKLVPRSCTCFNSRTFAHEPQRNGSALSRDCSRNVLLAGGADVHLFCPCKQQQLLHVVSCHSRTWVDIRQARHRRIDRRVAGAARVCPLRLHGGDKSPGRRSSTTFSCIKCGNKFAYKTKDELIPAIAPRNRDHPTANSCSCWPPPLAWSSG